jgi:pimeloyl-ACP methyl ester carboxylesterase
VKVIEVDGEPLACAERGSGSPVLFIHGTGSNSGTFEPVIDHLPGTVRAITYDRRGYGSSVGPPARRLGEHARDAAALLEVLAARPATVVGSSSGGVLALRLAAARPDLVSALVLIEPVYQAALIPSPSAAAAVGRVMLRWALRRDPKGAALRYYRWATSYAGGGNQFDTYPEEWQRAALSDARTALREVVQAMVPGPGPSAVRRIARPTTVLIGDAGLPVFHEASRRALRAIPQAREVTVPGAAHFVHSDEPAVCAAAIVDAVDMSERLWSAPNRPRS